MERLGNDHFIALRSLAKSRWVQGQQFEWKFNREWRLVSFGDVPAFDAVDRLMVLGLAEQVVCCSECKREVFQLTESGRAMVSRMNGSTAEPSPQEQEASRDTVETPHSGGWFNRLAQAFTTGRRA